MRQFTRALTVLACASAFAANYYFPEDVRKGAPKGEGKKK